MINLSAMIGRITGKSAESGMPSPGTSASGEAGSAASGGAFAALVQLVARTGQALEPVEPGVEAGIEIPAATLGLGDNIATAKAPDDAATALPQSVAVTSWAQLAGARTTPHKAATPPGPRVAPEAAATIASESALTPDEDKILPQSGDRPTASTADHAATDPVITAINSPEVTAIPTGAAITAVSAELKPAAIAKPSEAQDVVKARDGDSAMPLIATSPQVATTVEARPKGNMKFSTPPALPDAIEANGKVSSKTDDGTGPGAPGSIAPFSRRSEHAGSESAPLSPGSGVVGGAMPLRMIVDSLPPVVQSALTVGAVATISGPSTGQQLGDQVIDMAVSGQWIDRMAREITALAEGGGHSRFTLSPPHLGRLQVDLWQGQDATSVRFIAETDEAARRLGEGRATLQADARLVALNLGSVTIEKSALPQESPRDSSGQRPGSDTAGQTQQQAAGQGHAQGQNQAKAGSGEARGDWVGRSLRDDQDQQSDASPQLAARRAASGHVRFA